MITIICLFSDIDKARLATETLILSGFETEQMNIIVQQTIAKNKLFIADQSLKIEENKQKYPLSGLERLLGGKQPITTPDAGPVLCAGQEATNAANAAIYKPDKGLKFSLMESRLSEHDAQYYTNGIKEGGLLFWIRSDDSKAGEVVSILKYRNGLKVHSF
jgi:hypothetical protein